MVLPRRGGTNATGRGVARGGDRGRGRGRGGGPAKSGGLNPGLASRSSFAYRGKVTKIKHQLIHKAKVKKEFYKTLAKDDPSLQTPEFYKEIFGERTIDEDGNVIEYNRHARKKGHVEEGVSTRSDEEEEEDDADIEEKVIENDEGEDGDSDEIIKDIKKRPGGKRNNEKPRKPAKPNPFQKALIGREAAQKQREQERLAREKDIAERKRARTEYYEGRRKVRNKIMKKTDRGQPVLGRQVELLLGKIKGENTEKGGKKRKTREARKTNDEGGQGSEAEESE